MRPLVIYDPLDLQSSEPPPLSEYGWRFLAEGDSWFTIGSLNPAKNSNLLFEMAFSRSACAVNCGYPGDELRKMVRMNRDRRFMRLLHGREARHWDGLLLSAGGNDLIEALKFTGDDVAPAQRLLRLPHEWGGSDEGVARFVSEPGWDAFAAYLRSNLQTMLAHRDRGPSAGSPLFMHCYAVPTPRPAGAGLGMGPWLLPSLQAYRIPAPDHPALAELLIQRLAALLTACAAEPVAFPGLHVFDSTTLPIERARPGTRGEDGDWVNEIHLTWRGYEKLALAWAGEIERVLAPPGG